MKILITGGSGYVGTILIKKLLDEGHKVVNIDSQLFGNFLPKHKLLKNLKLDIRNINNSLFKKKPINPQEDILFDDKYNCSCIDS